jgi:hypothetical protein
MATDERCQRWQQHSPADTAASGPSFTMNRIVESADRRAAPALSVGRPDGPSGITVQPTVAAAVPVGWSVSILLADWTELVSGIRLPRSARGDCASVGRSSVESRPPPSTGASPRPRAFGRLPPIYRPTVPLCRLAFHDCLPILHISAGHPCVYVLVAAVADADAVAASCICIFARLFSRIGQSLNVAQRANAAAAAVSEARVQTD